MEADGSRSGSGTHDGISVYALSICGEPPNEVSGS
jgi:hypothetical protein